MDIMRRADFALLDRVYTPIAHWAYDEFGVRAHQLARACIVGLIIAAVLRHVGTVAHIIDAILLGGFIWMDSRRRPLALRMANPRRYDQKPRIVTVILGSFFSVVTGMFDSAIFAETWVWWLSLVNYVYFSSIDERPRKPKEAPQTLAMANE